jgi:uncharacterized membrane protein
MKFNRKGLGVALSVAVGGVLAGGVAATLTSCASEKSTPAADKHDCAGKNKCAGKGGCKTGDKGCAGKNTCAGKGGCAVPAKK